MMPILNFYILARHPFTSSMALHMPICTAQLRVNNSPHQSPLYYIIYSLILYTLLSSPMQKYRKWTDEATGINPFINARTTTFNISTLFISAITTVIKLHAIMLLAVPLLLSLALQQHVAKVPVLNALARLPMKIMNVLVGLWSVDDSNFKKWVERNRTNTNKKGNIILSNSVSILDAFYYLNTVPNARFVVSSPGQDKFQVLSGLPLLIKILTDKQPFFTLHPSQNSQNIKTLITRELQRSSNIIIFYEGIRTNGAGTIKISTALSHQLYSLEKDYCIVHLKYSSAPEGLFSMVSNPAILFCIALGTWSISLKVRCNPISIDTQHSGADVQKDIDTFLMANAAKLLDTDPQSYFQFLQFYHKTQKGGYTQIPEEEKEKEKIGRAQ